MQSRWDECPTFAVIVFSAKPCFVFRSTSAYHNQMLLWNSLTYFFHIVLIILIQFAASLFKLQLFFTCHRYHISRTISQYNHRIFFSQIYKSHIACRLLLNTNIMMNSPGDSFYMVTSWHGNAFHITGPLWGEFMDCWWINLKMASNVELLSFLCWTSCGTNSRVAGDLRHHDAHVTSL